ncbi:alpha-D-ribose 1-methylphosphonate 5-triphosphate synthase subunit PhnG [Thalassovita litoralis]|uniref:Alpha-D-ribose 1-methylphosphonate 5-triphosphate synthase subunit PhnG n=1 Tax=Thalassovita litoralis TaxID=1010611 RepID=A0A521EPL6_9RHOB|nr:phosphonate C-P lyase system protein PhnG [Thalassovita litoralis]SMO85864.1 alpha-D-ribose 1-methylphosphonate 5-triphosphate synthase subunit PhnG [Thalassovita litoralis]
MDPNAERKNWMSLLAKAPSGVLAGLWANYGAQPGFDWLRPPEIGGAMVRGRMGGTGAAFNLGEMTVTRCSLRLTDGPVGHAYVQGRDKDKARIAAQVDALMQGPGAADVRAAILTPLADQIQARRNARAAKAAATKVEFFTMVRGED